MRGVEGGTQSTLSAPLWIGLCRIDVSNPGGPVLLRASDIRGFFYTLVTLLPAITSLFTQSESPLLQGICGLVFTRIFFPQVIGGRVGPDTFVLVSGATTNNGPILIARATEWENQGKEYLIPLTNPALCSLLCLITSLFEPRRRLLGKGGLLWLRLTPFNPPPLFPQPIPLSPTFYLDLGSYPR